MAYSGAPKVPNGFSNLYDAWNHPLPRPNDKHVFNVIGVCVDFLECCKTRGTDYTMKFTLHDPYSTDAFGTSFQLFVVSPSMAPAIKNQGDVVICRNAEIFNSPKMGKYATLKKGVFTWAVIEHASLSNSSGDAADLTVHLSETQQKKAPYPTAEEISYAKAILALEDGSRWQAPAPSTALQISGTMAANGGTPNRSIGKHRIVSEIDVPANNRCYVDMTVEIRRFFETDLRLECSVTDYTENQYLYNYAYRTSTDDAAYDAGDPYGYSDKSRKQLWTGPWGKRTMTVVLWEPHRTFALKTFAVGDFVSLRNVHIKMDSLGAKLEGVIHGDHLNADKILVSKLRAADAEYHDNLKDLLRRKRTHEEFCKQSGLPFIREADVEKLKKFTARMGHDQPAVDGASLESNHNESAKAKKNRKKKEKQRAKAAAKGGGQPADGSAGHNGNSNGNSNDTVPSLAPNAHIRTNVSAASLIRVDEILDPKLLERETLGGTKWTAPFQNARYKSKVVVVGYWPKRLEEWVVRVRKNQYAALEEGSEEDEDVDMDGGEESERMDVDGDEDRRSADEDGDGARWEWRFALLVQDPIPATRTRPQNGVAGAEGEQKPRQIELMASGQDAEYLLREEACDLRRNRKALARLREKMFVLWGNLQERMEEQEEEAEKTKAEKGGDVGGGMEQGQVLAQARSQPFECYIAEYGVKKEGRAGQRAEDWERCWRMVHTTVA